VAPRESLNVAVLGAGGYVGGELLRLLSGHPAVSQLRAHSTSAAGMSWSEVHPSLLHVAEGRFEVDGPDPAGHSADVVFLAMPHGRAQDVVPGLLGAAARLLVDTSADFRLHDRDRFESSYGPHASWDAVTDFAYGLADVAGSTLAGRRLIAAPGCFATAALLALYPFVSEGLVEGVPTVFAITGSSGAGREPRPTTHHPARAHSFFAYSLSGHRHEAEVGEQLERWSDGRVVGCNLMTHAAPLVRGIHVTALLSCTRPVADPNAVVAGVYSDRPFVKVLDRPPAVAEVVGTNYAHLHAAARGNGREVAVTAVIDNLLKGAAGQAVQAMNLALSLDETLGLGQTGAFPC